MDTVSRKVNFSIIVMTGNHLLLYGIAERMLEHEQHILPVDLLFDDEQIGDFVKSIQIDSPYQQMLFEGVLTESVKDEKLYVSFTVEGYFHYVLGEVIFKQTEGKESDLLKIMIVENQLNGVREGVEQCLILDIYKFDLSRLIWLIDNLHGKTEIFVTPLIASLKYFGVDKTLTKLLENDTENDWRVLIDLVSKLNDLHLFKLADEVTDSAISKKNNKIKSSIIFCLKSNNLHPIDAEELIHSLLLIYPDFENDYQLLNLIGDTYRRYSYDANDEVLKFYTKSLFIYQNNIKQCDDYTAFLHKKIASVYRSKNDSNLALEFYTKSLQFYEAQKESATSEIANLYENIGLIYKSKMNFDTAIEFFEKSLSLQLAAFGKVNVFVQKGYSYLADCWEEKGKYEKAIKYHENAFIIANKIKESHDRFEFSDFSINSIANCYIKAAKNEERKKNFPKAFELYQKGIQYIQGLNIPDGNDDVRDLYFTIAIYFKDNKEYFLAIDYLLKCISIDDEDMEACFCIAQCYENTDDESNAYKYYFKTIIIFESVCFDDIQNYINGKIAYDEKININPFAKVKEYAHKFKRVNELPDWIKSTINDL